MPETFFRPVAAFLSCPPTLLVTMTASPSWTFQVAQLTANFICVKQLTGKCLHSMANNRVMALRLCQPFLNDDVNKNAGRIPFSHCFRQFSICPTSQYHYWQRPALNQYLTPCLHITITPLSNLICTLPHHTSTQRAAAQET